MAKIRFVLLACVFLTLAGMALATEGPPTFVGVVPANDDGIPGNGPGDFNNPQGVFVDRGGFIYVADSGNNRVQKFSSTGVFLQQFGTGVLGQGNTQLAGPFGVCADSVGNVYIADTGNSRIVKYLANGIFKKIMNTGVALTSPRDVKVIGNSLYVMNTLGSPRVLRYNFANDSTLTSVIWGTAVDNNYTGPQNYSLSGRIADSYIVAARSTTSTSKPAVFKIAKSSGVVSAISTPINTDCNDSSKVCSVTSVAMDSSGNLFTVDGTYAYPDYPNRITKWSSTGTKLARWAGSSSDTYPFPGYLWGAFGISIGDGGLLVVSDRDDQRIQIWKYGAAVPDTAYCRIPPVIISPANTGMGATAPYSMQVMGLGATDVPYIVKIANASGPIAGTTVTLGFGAICDTMLTWCSTQQHPTVSAITDSLGNATFFISGGGCLDPANTGGWIPVSVYAAGKFLKNVGVVSLDVCNSASVKILDTGSNATGRSHTDGNVNLSDATYFTGKIKIGAYDFCSDFNGDHKVDLNDAILLTRVVKKGPACP